MKTKKSVKKSETKTVAPPSKEASVPISLSVKPGMERVLPLLAAAGPAEEGDLPQLKRVGPRVEIGTDPGPQLGEYFRRGKVRALQVASLDAKAGTFRDQQGTVWPIVDRRVLDSGAGPGDWFVVHHDGFVARLSDRDFKEKYEPAGGWPGDA